jgi:hypothetical protein
MSGSAFEGSAHNPRFTRIAGIAGLVAAVAWAVVVIMELAHASIGHSLTARPERFFSDSAWHLPLVSWSERWSPRS